jgi:hypothetical protein
MKYQRALHDVFAGKSVAARARRAAFDVVRDADSAVSRLTSDLALAAETLRRYERLHRDKGTPESLVKAVVNATLASQFERTIQEVGLVGDST